MAVYSVWESHFPSGSAPEGLEVTKAIRCAGLSR